MNALTTNNKIVHGLWIGQTLSSLELLCIRSFLAIGHEFHLWLYDLLETPIPSEVIIEDASLIISRNKVFYYNNKNQFGHGEGSYAGFSDIFRYKLLYEKGGWWTDMDVVCLKPFDFPEPYVFRTHHELRIVGNIMKCPAGSDLMNECYKAAILQVTADSKDWTLPIRILNDHICKFGLNTFMKEFTNPDSWLYITKILLFKVRIPSHWHALHLINEEWRRNRINKNAILKGSVVGMLLYKYGIWKPLPKYHYLANIIRLIFPRFSGMQLRFHLMKMFK
jgi:hypothetical protein